MSKRLLAGVACLVMIVAACGSGSSTPPNTAASPSPSGTGPVASTAIPSPAVSPGATAPVGSPAASDGTDLLTVLAGARTSLQKPGTVRVDLTMTGTFDAGTKAYPWIVDLTGAQIEVDYDVAHKWGVINVSIPGMDGFTEEIRLIDPLEYARSSLGGNFWTRQQANGSIGSIVQLLVDPTGSVLMDALSHGNLNAALASDTTFNGTPARQVTVSLTVPATYDIESTLVSALGSKVGATPDPNVLTGPTKSLPIQVFLAADDMRPLGFSLSMPSGASDPDVVGADMVSIEGIVSRPSGTLLVKAPDKFVDSRDPFNPPH